MIRTKEVTTCFPLQKKKKKTGILMKISNIRLAF